MGPHLLDDAFFNCVDGLRQPGDVVQLIACEFGDQPRLVSEPRRDRSTMLGKDQRFEFRRADRVQLVDAPL